ncbi:MAG: protoheme IX farnesyltransferase [Planctomycetaceae bacterium]|nr:protoheme IX farnesyltransferase [Planctomycetaceae bacterium]
MTSPLAQTVVPASATSRFADYMEIAKPRIALVVLFTVTVGYLLGAEGTWDLLVWLHTCVGVALAATASNALNQYIERHSDARMQRTKLRPIPAGRLPAREVLVVGLVLAVISPLYLLFFVNAQTALLTFATIALYAGAYTPLKSRTAFCTAVGAIPGALPPVLGFAASGAALDWRAVVLFSVLFVWQFPHFLAIAWIYKKDYQTAGLQMLPANGKRYVAGCIAVAYALVLIPISMLPKQLGLSGEIYAWTALLLGVMYLIASVKFLLKEDETSARGLLRASFIHLPVLLFVMTADHIWLLQ